MKETWHIRPMTVKKRKLTFLFRIRTGFILVTGTWENFFHKLKGYLFLYVVMRQEVCRCYRFKCEQCCLPGHVLPGPGCWRSSTWCWRGWWAHHRAHEGTWWLFPWNPKPCNIRLTCVFLMTWCYSHSRRQVGILLGRWGCYGICQCQCSTLLKVFFLMLHAYIYIYILYSSWLCWQVPKAEPMDVKD